MEANENEKEPEGERRAAQGLLGPEKVDPGQLHGLGPLIRSQHHTQHSKNQNQNESRNDGPRRG